MTIVRIGYRAVVEVDLDLQKIRKYLISKDWVEDEPFGPYAIIFRNDNDGLIKFITNDKIADLNARMSELVHDLAEYEHRSVPDILADLTR